MKTKKVDKKKTLAYAVAFYFTDVSVKFMMGNAMYEYVHTVYDRRYDNGGFNTLVIVYNYKRLKYEAMDYKMKKLSAYTVASNCTDLTDIRDGIAEIHEAMKTCVESGKHIPSFYVSRLAKLETKKKKLEKRTQVHMTVTIRFFIDDDTLTMAVRHCLFFKLEPTRQNVMKAIRDAVLNNGRSILDFPEAWGEDLMDVSFFDVENAMKKLRSSFGL